MDTWFFIHMSLDQPSARRSAHEFTKYIGQRWSCFQIERDISASTGQCVDILSLDWAYYQWAFWGLRVENPSQLALSIFDNSRKTNGPSTVCHFCCVFQNSGSQIFMLRVEIPKKKIRESSKIEVLVLVHCWA